MIRGLWTKLRQPISAEKRALLAARWNELPPELQVEWQVVGRHHVHCGFTLGPSYCSFGCTHCYLPPNANRAPIPSLEDMKAQIDANRRLIGAGGGLQLTGGDVVDAYWRAHRAEELITLVRYANDAGVVPMLMTHGQLLLENPDYLDRLVVEGGLRKLAIHVDITQAGRPGFPLRDLKDEADLHPLRERFVDLIHGVRQRTGLAFSAAQTVTVTERNLGDVGEILRWMISNPRRLKAFRMVSFQPEANVGRTRFSTQPVTPEATWQRVSAAFGQDLPQDNMWVGHPDCSHFTSLLVLYPERRVVNLIGADRAGRDFWPRLLAAFGGVGSRGESHLDANVRRLGLILRHPQMLVEVVRYAWRLKKRENLGLFRLLGAFLGGRFGVLNVVQHNFMSDEELAQPQEEVVAKRLMACSFRGAVKRGDQWEAVPMCTMNSGPRENLYAEQIAAGDILNG